MFESLTASDWIQIAVLVVTTVGPLAWWMFNMERHASKTATYMELMSASIQEDQAENKEAHEVIHRRIDTTNQKVDSCAKETAEHGIHINNLLSGRS
ncbi:hypothetical protein [Gimesia fumaroli]|uniref:Uncharacterized protein n=1 Tax=Gimesia fumaroli TaxID=2527976 RepID=A0A518I8Z3_9PLAN|nr:hypothetical protein [Gimesia fumaroli]QDV49567.1 hypothetical protein Enr17x_15870 [Gimesia fumaroli]